MLSKRLYQKKKEETQYLSKEDFKQLLTFLFKRQGYSVNSVKKQTPIADLILRKKGSKVVVHIMTSHKSISADKITEVKDNRHKLKAQKTIIVSNNNFTEEAKKVAKAYRLTLMDYETVEAMIDAIKAPKGSTALLYAFAPF
nr:restriction endonuclease [Bacillus sp. JCM 19034]